MSTIVNFGSINIDYVYKVPHFLRAGETLEASARAVHMGGKGLNQTVAMLRAGLSVRHAGIVGADGESLVEFLRAAGAKLDAVKRESAMASGHTFIQVTPDAENAILYFPGTNHAFTPDFVDSVLATLSEGDVVLTQNEVNGVPAILEAAKRAGAKTVFVPAPYEAAVREYPLHCVDAMILNETEAADFLGLCADTDYEEILEKLGRALPHAHVILTRGAKGIAWRCANGATGAMPGFVVKAVDTTGAGDTFAGYAMLALMSLFEGREEAFEPLLERAVLASALSVTKEGAVVSIPTAAEVDAAHEESLTRGSLH